MKIEAYLEDRKETIRAFAQRAGVSEASVKRIKRLGTANSRTVADKIVRASEGAITIADLYPDPVLEVRTARKRKASAH